MSNFFFCHNVFKSRFLQMYLEFMWETVKPGLTEARFFHLFWTLNLAFLQFQVTWATLVSHSPSPLVRSLPTIHPFPQEAWRNLPTHFPSILATITSDQWETHQGPIIHGPRPIQKPIFLTYYIVGRPRNPRHDHCHLMPETPLVFHWVSCLYMSRPAKKPNIVDSA